MHMAAAQRVWTVEDVLALPDDGNRYELIDGGLLVSPAPRLPHQAAVFAMQQALHAYLSMQPLGYDFHAPADLRFGPATLVQPDVFVAPPVDGKRPKEWVDISTLLLVVEIVSPSSALNDRMIKRTLYQRVGIPDYWIVDLSARRVERWRPSDARAEVCTGSISWRPFGSSAPLVLDLPAFFREVWDED